MGNPSFPGSAWERIALPAPPACLRGGASLPVGYGAEPRNQRNTPAFESCCGDGFVPHPSRSQICYNPAPGRAPQVESATPRTVP